MSLVIRLKKFFFLFCLTLFFYSLARLEFLIWNFSQFKDRDFLEILTAFLVGVRFDLSAVAYLSLIPLLAAFVPWSKFKMSLSKQNFFQYFLYMFIQVPFIIFSLIDTVYVDFVGRRFTWDTLLLWNDVRGKVWSILTPYMGLFLINVFILVIYILLSWKLVQRVDSSNRSIGFNNDFKGNLKKNTILVVASLVLTIVATRGGLQRVLLHYVDADVFNTRSLNNLVLNSAFTFLKSYTVPIIRREKYFQSRLELQAQLNGGVNLNNGAGLVSKWDRSQAKPIENIIILILESFGTEYTAQGGEPSYTPFLDKLAKKSLYFYNGMANGRRSFDGVPAVVGGIPALMNQPFIFSQFASNDLLGLGTLLNKNGFSTAFFHGGNNHVFFFDIFIKHAGVSEHFGENEYPNKADHDGTWGIWDEPFLQWTVEKIGQLKRPFAATIFTLSSHEPFRMPEKYKDQFSGGPLLILKTVQYADFALQRFFESAEKEPWFEKTLFILTADHTSLHFRPEFENNEVGNYRIPILFYQKDQKWPVLDTRVPASQIDILPTVLEMLDIDPPLKNLFGRSLFLEGERSVVNFINGRYLIVTEKDWMIWNPSASTDSSKKLSYYEISDVHGKKPLSDEKRVGVLVGKIKAHIQYFSEATWDNRLYYPINRRETRSSSSSKKDHFPGL